MSHIVIIGNGIAGITTARHVRKRSNHDITLISAETDFHFSRPALMYIYMGHMKYEHTKPYEDWFWSENRLNLVRGFVETIDTDRKTLSLQGGRTIEYDKLVIATGSKSNKFGWKGQDLNGVQGLYSFQDLELMEENTRGLEHGKGKAVVVGGGLIGIEVAEMLHSRHIPVTMLVREPLYWSNILPKEEAELVGRHIRAQGVELRLSSELQEITSDENGRAKSVIAKSGEEFPAQFVALTAGVSPNIDVVKTSKIATKRGVLVNEFLETNIPDVYAAGDCAELQFPDGSDGRSDIKTRIEQLWYTGRMHGEALAQTLCGKRTKYERGIWFNSAKFFDIEYQTYGFVANSVRDGETHFYWENSDGDKCMRIVYRSDTRAVTGMNVFGIRQRQAVWQRWIAEKKTIDAVIEHLGEANFDPEFFKEHERDIVEKFNSMNPPKRVQLQRKRGLFSVLQFKRGDVKAT